MRKLLFVFVVVMMSLPMMVMAQCGTNLTATDQDGAIYQSLKVGPHCWMKTNLKTKVSGSRIYRSDMYLDTTSNLEVFGRLYPWSVAVGTPMIVGEHNFVQGVCPDGWHLPSPAEVQQLSTNRASNVRTAEQWLIPGNNTTGFSLLPGGFYNNGTLRCENLSGEAYLWSVGAAGEPVEVWTDCHCDMILLNPGKVNNALSVRCVYKIYQAQVATNSATNISEYQADLNGNVVFAGYDQNFTKGFVYGTDMNDLSNDTAQLHQTAEGPYSFKIENLESNTKYYYRAYVVNEFDTAYGAMRIFTTLPITDTIVFHPNGGQGTMDTMFVIRGNAVLNANAYTHDGNWQFASWNTEADGSGTAYANQASITTNGNLTLYAQWGTWCAGTPRTNELGTSRIDSVKDHENNWYKVVQIGSQCWLKENLRTTTEPNGSTIVLNADSSSNTTPMAYSRDVSKYGYLYNFSAAMNVTDGEIEFAYLHRGICPEGWHIPTNEEWTTLAAEAGVGIGEGTGAGKLVGGNDWYRGYYDSATYPGSYGYAKRDSTGFSALPAGYGAENGAKEVGYEAGFWSFIPNENENASEYRWCLYIYEFIDKKIEGRSYGHSVRCLRDEETPTAMSVTTDSANHVATTEARLHGNVTNMGERTSVKVGFKYGTSESSLTSIVADESEIIGTGRFYYNIIGLAANTTYYFKAFVANGTDTVYGEVKNFTTLPIVDTIAFHPNGGQGTMDTIFVTRGEQVTLPANGFTHDGNWEFTGWNDACDGTGNIYTVAENITTRGNLTLYAQWHTWCTGNPQNNELGTSRIDSVKDHENNWYKVVRIGSQCWLKENLRTTTEPNGGTIVLNADSNSNTTPMAYSSNVAKYGYLYNFAAAMNIADDATDFSYPHRGICPNGWHIPTNEEWTTLAAEAGVDINDGAGAGGAGKLVGGKDWNDAEEATAPGNYNYTTRDSTGFFALPAGYSYGLGDYGVGGYAYFWSATSDESIRAYSWFIVSDYEYISNSSQMRYYGSSLRCLRDAEASVITDTIAFVPNGGMGTMDSILVTRGEQATLPTNGFTHEGNWEFTGWNDACDGTGNIYTVAENIITNGNLTLYAQWHTWCAGNPQNNELGTSRIDSVKDVNNNKYAVVQIGNQCWLKENMRATTEPSGTNTIEINAGELSENSPMAYSNSNEYLMKYGYLYNYSAAMNVTDDANSYEYPHQGICPQGWHIPTDEEWNTLMVSAGVNRMNGDEGVGKLTGGCDWEETAEKPYSPGNYSYSKRDSSGFSILPAGLNMGDGIVYAGFGATFWSSTSHAHDEGPLYWAILNSNIEESGYVQNSNNDRFVGLSVRCLRDAEASVVTDTIAFLPNGGQGTMDTMFVTRGNTVLNANTFTHSGNWQFLGWNTKADGSGTAYANKASLTTNGNLTLYAQWGTYCAGTPRANELGTSRIDSVKDVDNNKYAVVQIDNQCWMRQNLRTNVDGGVYPENGNQREQDSILYGRLYTWTAMMNGASSTNYPVGSTAADTIVQGICPTGWHVPSASEWNALVTYVKGVTEYKCGGEDDPIAKALSSNMGWKSSNESCAPGESESVSENNLTGFSALPAGYYNSGTKNFSKFAYFWSATQHSDKEAVDYYLQYKESEIQSYRSKKDHGESVRCLRDNE